MPELFDIKYTQFSTWNVSQCEFLMYIYSQLVDWEIYQI